jgi:hypothetical protein
MVIVEIHICHEAAKSGPLFGAQSALDVGKVKRGSASCPEPAREPQDNTQRCAQLTWRNIALATKDMAV